MTMFCRRCKQILLFMFGRLIGTRWGWQLCTIFGWGSVSSYFHFLGSAAFQLAMDSPLAVMKMTKSYKIPVECMLFVTARGRAYPIICVNHLSHMCDPPISTHGPSHNDFHAFKWAPQARPYQALKQFAILKMTISICI